MKQKVTYIGIYQLTLLVITVIISTADIMLPSMIARISGRNSWISVIIAGAASLVINYVFLMMMQKFPSQGMFTLSKYAFGSGIGSLLCVCYGFVFIFYNFLVIRQIADVMYTVFIPSQSIVFFVIFTMVIVTISVYYGIECISRVNELFIPLGIAALAAVIGLSIKRMDLSNFLPVLENGIKPVMRGSVTIMFWLMEATIIAFLIPDVKKSKYVPLSSVIILTVITSALLMGVLIIAVFGTEFTARMIYSPVNLMAYVRIGKFYDTLDIFIMLIWVGGVLVKSSVLTYLSVQSFSAGAGSKKKDSLIVPVCFISAVFAITEFKNPAQLSAFMSYYAPVFGFFTFIILPAVVLSAAFMRKRSVG